VNSESEEVRVDCTAAEYAKEKLDEAAKIIRSKHRLFGAFTLQGDLFLFILVLVQVS